MSDLWQILFLCIHFLFVSEPLNDRSSPVIFGNGFTSIAVSDCSVIHVVFTHV